jgi:hypothetical protein
MTSMLSGGRDRRATRTAVAAGAAVLGLIALSACGEKPTPVATITIGSSSVHTEATCYSEDKELGAGKLRSCLEQRDDAKTIEASEGGTIRFGVDPEISENGWQLYLNGQQLTETFESTYRTFPSEQVFSVAAQSSQTGTVPESLDISIIEARNVDGQGGGEAYGVWNFTLHRE